VTGAYAACASSQGTGGPRSPRCGKGRDSCARPRAEGGLYQRGGGEGKEERGEGREVGVGERPECRETRANFEHCSSVFSKVLTHWGTRGQGRGVAFHARGFEPQVVLTWYEVLSTGQDASHKPPGPNRRERRGGGEGVPKGGCWTLPAR